MNNQKKRIHNITYAVIAQNSFKAFLSSFYKNQSSSNWRAQTSGRRISVTTKENVKYFSFKRSPHHIQNWLFLQHVPLQEAETVWHKNWRQCWLDRFSCTVWSSRYLQNLGRKKMAKVLELLKCYCLLKRTSWSVIVLTKTFSLNFAGW